jgi:hypothetical protein
LCAPFREFIADANFDANFDADADDADSGFDAASG